MKNNTEENTVTRQQLQYFLGNYKEDGMTNIRLSAPTAELQAEYNRVRADIDEFAEAHKNITKAEMQREIAQSLSNYLKARFGDE